MRRGEVWGGSETGRTCDTVASGDRVSGEDPATRVGVRRAERGPPPGASPPVRDPPPRNVIAHDEEGHDMGLFDRLFGSAGDTPDRAAAPAPTPTPRGNVGGQRDEDGRYAPPPPAGAPGRAASGSADVDDRQAIERYRYLLRTAPPETVEQVHAEAFGRLTPSQRRQVLEEMSAGLSPAERPAGDDPGTLARAATRAEYRQPGFMERTFGGRSFGAGGGPGFGSMLGASMLGTIGGYVVGSALVGAMFDPGYDAGYADGVAADATGDGTDIGGGDAAGADVGGFGGDVGGDLGGGDFGGGDFGGDFGF